MMTADEVVRAGAVLGVIGGVVRAAASFSPMLIASDDARTWLYAGIAAVATGVMPVAFSEWRAMRLAAWIPATFALSLALGSIGTSSAGTLFIVSGILFGGAFAAMAITALLLSAFVLTATKTRRHEVNLYSWKVQDHAPRKSQRIN